MSRFDRRNQAKQRQLLKQKEHHSQTSIFAGRDGAPRVVAVISLCADGDALSAIRHMNDSLDIETGPESGSSLRVSVDRFKQQLQYIPVKRDLTSCLDAARVADFVVIILSAAVEVDKLGELILRSVESQGLSTLFTVVQGLEAIESVKQRQQTLVSLKSFITHFHPGQEKLFSLENRNECSNLVRALCNTTPKGVYWRDERSWMLVENVKFPMETSQSTIFTGVIRGKCLKADRLLQVGDWGTFQIEKIVAAPLPKQRKADEGTADTEVEEKVLEIPGEDQDGLAELAPDEVFMDAEDFDDVETTVTATSKKGVLLDDHHYFTDEEAEERAARKIKVPKGTSTYQAAWHLDDVPSESGSDMDDFEMQDDESTAAPAGPEDGIEGFAPREPTEAIPTEYAQSEMFVEPNEIDDAEQLVQFRAGKRDEARDDRQFPDEIELEPNALARERLARYRGLKSLRTSRWDEDEDRAHEPEEWRKLLQVPDYQASRSKVLREALVGGVAPGTRVHIYVKDVPVDARASYDPARPLNLFSLLRHENKKTAVNYLISLSADYPGSIKAKEELIVQCGPRRFTIKPLFSQPGSTPNDVHKYCRYLHPGQSAIATFMGPVTWGSVPLLFFKKMPESIGDDGEPTLPLSLVATGTSLPPSTSRVIAKRIILTGHPYHIHKKIVTIRYMFFNAEDVNWFKAMPLWTKRGRSGYVKETLGTHGYFKANFDGRINPQDAVGISLYKRVWPRNSVRFQGPLLELVEGDGQGDVVMD
jgi:pre-rRNA-processing protein TSR1